MSKKQRRPRGPRDLYPNVSQWLAERDAAAVVDLRVRARFGAERVAASPILARVGARALGSKSWIWYWDDLEY